MDLKNIMKLKSAWSGFSKNHPRFPAFAQEIKNRGVQEGTVIDISFRYPDDTTVHTNLKVNGSDVELINTFLG